MMMVKSIQSKFGEVIILWWMEYLAWPLLKLVWIMNIV